MVLVHVIYRSSDGQFCIVLVQAICDSSVASLVGC
jgi:hypothetical protein